ncbi:APC family permease [Subtercola sp. YIM 133946]|uniref:APC family permease n=1 Tax=Subtercola sp. YIM 133946 TaxID=3118909 RepID=UPI002F91C013
MTASPTARPATTPAPTAPSRRRLGVPAVTFMIVAASAPLTVLAGGVTTTFAVTGVLGVPLSFLILGAALTIFAVGYAAMNRFVTNAGAFYAYIAQGLGRPLGVGSSIVALISYNAMQIGIYGIFGYTVSNLLSERLGISVPWYVPVFVCIAVVGVLGVNRVDLSAKVLGILVGLEFLVVIIYDVSSFAVAPEGVTGVAFEPSSLFVTGIGAVFAFGIAAFMGFESAAIYGEESKDPKRTVARATYTAVAIIALFYALSAWAMTVGIGPSQVVAAATEQGPNLIFGFLGDHVSMVISDIAQVLFVTSVFASLVSFHNAVARYFFSLGREGVLPAAMGRIGRRGGAPVVGSLTQTVIAVVVVIGFAIAGAGSPLGDLYPVITLFTWLTNTGAMGLVLLMALISLAVIGFFRRHPASLSSWSTMVAPIISFIALATIWVLILVNYTVLLGQAEPDASTFLLPAIVLVPGLVGVWWGFRLKRSNPRVYRQIGHGADDPEAQLDADVPADAS